MDKILVPNLDDFLFIYLSFII